MSIKIGDTVTFNDGLGVRTLVVEEVLDDIKNGRAGVQGVFEETINHHGQVVLMGEWCYMYDILKVATP